MGRGSAQQVHVSKQPELQQELELSEEGLVLLQAVGSTVGPAGGGRAARRLFMP